MEPSLLATAAINSEYTAVKGATLLGKSTSKLTAASDGVGFYETYQKGGIYWSPTTGAHDLYGSILSKYLSLGTVKFGYPTTNEAADAGNLGLFSHFSSPTSKGAAVSAIDWTAAHGAHAVTGPIATLFASKGWEKSGVAISDEVDLTATGGKYQYFEDNIIFGVLPYAIDYTPKGGASIHATSSYTDISQGSNGTCWIDASMAAMELSGHDLSQEIKYLGNNEYSVNLYVPKNPAQRPAGGYKPITVDVHFDGSTYPTDSNYSASIPSQSWTVVMQRAIIEAVATWSPSQSIQNPHSGGSGDALATLTGKAATLAATNASNTKQQVLSALAAGKTITMGTLGTTSTLVGDHVYAVVSANAQGVTLYNPWGAQETAPTPDPQLVSWSVIAKDGAQFFFD